MSFAAMFPAAAFGSSVLTFQFSGIRLQQEIIENTDSELEKQISKIALSALCGMLTVTALYICFPHLCAVTYASTGLTSMVSLYLLTGLIRNE